jgi:hypothetical protein
MNEFDEELEKIFVKLGIHTMQAKPLAIEAIKQAIEKHVIGDSDVAMTISPPIGLGGLDREWTDGHEAMRKAQYRDQLRNEQRQILHTK